MIPYGVGTGGNICLRYYTIKSCRDKTMKVYFYCKDCDIQVWIKSESPTDELMGRMYKCPQCGRFHSPINEGDDYEPGSHFG